MIPCHPFTGTAATYGYEVDMERLTEVHSEAGLYQLHKVSLMRFASALVGPDDAADVVSDAMLSLLKSGKLVEAKNPEALLHRAVMAKAKSLQRSVFARRARERRFADRWIEEQPSVRPDVVRAVTRLSSRQRACVYLTYWEDLSPTMVADHLGIGEGSVKRHLARARAKLREVIDD